MRNAIAACLLLVLSGSPIAGAQPERGNRPRDPGLWAPSDAVLFVAIDDLTDLLGRWKQMAFWDMFSDPDLKDLSASFSLPQKLAEQFRNRLAEALELKPDQLENPFAGSIVLYASNLTDEQPQVALIAGVGNAELMQKYYRRATRRFRELSDQHEKVEFRSYTIDSFVTERDEDQEADDEDEADEDDLDAALEGGDDLDSAVEEMLSQLFSPEAMPEKLALCLTADRLILAPTPEIIKAVLRRGESETLCDNELYRALTRKFDPPGQLRFMVDLQKLLEAVAAEGDEETAQTIKMLGLNGVRGIIAHADYGSGGYEGRLEAELLVSGQRSGLIKILSMKNTPVKRPQVVVNDAFAFGWVNLDLGELLDEIERMVRQMDPAGADELRTTLESVPFGEEETLDIRKGLLAFLAPPLSVSMGFEKPYSAQSSRLLLTIAARQRQPLQQLLEKLSELAAGMLIDRELRGTFIYDVSMGGFSIAVSEQAVLIGSTPCVERGIQGTAEQPPADDFARLARLVPPDAWCVVYSDPRRMYEAVFELARQKDQLAMQFGNPAAMVTAAMVEALVEDIPPDQLDKAKALLKYQAPSLMTIRTTSDGIYVISVQAPPEASKARNKTAKSE